MQYKLLYDPQRILSPKFLAFLNMELNKCQYYPKHFINLSSLNPQIITFAVGTITISILQMRDLREVSNLPEGHTANE